MTMTGWIDHSDGGMTPSELAERVFSGRIVVFQKLDAAHELVRETRSLLGEVFEGRPPTRAFETLGAEAYRERMKTARSRFRKSEAIGRLYHGALIEAGADPETSYVDQLSLRSAPPFEAAYGRGFGQLPPHRDSWGAGLDCQINWWLPFYEITEERTMAIFPRYWDRPVANDSDGWDWTRALREPDYPPLPSAREPIDWTEAIHLVVPPGALVAFSGSHLHATVPNRSNEARISSDTRSVDLSHLRQGRGAPNVDRGTNPPGLDWFRHIQTGERLREAFPA